MAAGGTFLALLAAGTLAAALAFVPAPPGGACYVAEVIVIGGSGVVGTSDEETSSTLYVDAAVMYEGVLFGITTVSGAAKMWVPRFRECFDKGHGWYKTYAFCELQKENSLVKCDFMVGSCKYSCVQDILPGGDVAFTLHAYGYSRWRRTEPPAGCVVHNPLYNPTITFDRCFSFGQATPRPWTTLRRWTTPRGWTTPRRWTTPRPVTLPCPPTGNCTDGFEVVFKANASLSVKYRDNVGLADLIPVLG